MSAAAAEAAHTHTHTAQKMPHPTTSAAAEPRWFDLAQRCKHCGDDDWCADFGPRTMLVCSACGVGCAHVGCEGAVNEAEYDEDFVTSGAEWFCSEV